MMENNVEICPVRINKGLTKFMRGPSSAYVTTNEEVTTMASSLSSMTGEKNENRLLEDMMEIVASLDIKGLSRPKENLQKKLLLLKSAQEQLHRPSSGLDEDVDDELRMMHSRVNSSNVAGQITVDALTQVELGIIETPFPFKRKSMETTSPEAKTAPKDRVDLNELITLCMAKPRY